MTTLQLNPEEIRAVLQRHLEAYQPGLDVTEVGRIVSLGDGIAHVSGLPNAAVNEMLEFEGGVVGLALNLDEEEIGAVVLGEYEHLSEGGLVRDRKSVV